MPEFWWEPTTREKFLKPRPWLHDDVIAYLESLLRPEFEVLEHGSGGSTLWFADRVQHVTSVEISYKWYRTLKKMTALYRNVDLIYQVAGEIPDLDGRRFDMVVIDGVPLEDRVLYLEALPDLLKPGGIAVLDNANRPDYAEQRERLMANGLLASFDRNDKRTSFMVTDFYQIHEVPA